MTTALFSSLISLVLIGTTEEIRWRGGADTAMPDVAQGVDDSVRSLAAGGVARHVIVRCKRPLSIEQRNALERAGLVLQAPLGAHSFFALLDGARADATEIAGLALLKSVEAVQRSWKLHPAFLTGDIPAWAKTGEKGTNRNEDVKIAAYVMFHRDVRLVPDGLAVVVKHSGVVKARMDTINGLVIMLPLKNLPAFADEDAVQWVEPPIRLLTEQADRMRAATQVDTVQEDPPSGFGLDGTGVTVMVYDTGEVDESHPDFAGRLTLGDDTYLGFHATHVAGILAGSGANSLSHGSTDGQWRGVADGAEIVSYTVEPLTGVDDLLFTNPGDLEDDYEEAIHAHGAQIANNSIGSFGPDCFAFGAYSVTAALIDSIVRGSLGSPFRVVFANGNNGGELQCGHSANARYGTTRAPACAKNHITVGNVMSDFPDTIWFFSSYGPCNDGRIKPDLVAPGWSFFGPIGITSCHPRGGYRNLLGTSMASPVVTGICALLMQDIAEQFPSRPVPTNGTLKALLTHSALDIATSGPDYASGFGLVQAADAASLVRSNGGTQFLEALLEEIGETAQWLVQVDLGDPELKITLAWDDVAGTPNIDDALVNDLDLRVYAPDGTRYYPWQLDPSDPQSAAQRTSGADGQTQFEDHINIIEQVLVDDPASGTWRVQVTTTQTIDSPPQLFSLVASHVLIPDCNSNDVADTTDIANMTSEDCSFNGIPDECEPDCQGNESADSCDIQLIPALDANGNGILDMCEPDCDANGTPDVTDIDTGQAEDCNHNHIPDSCDILSGSSMDCTSNSMPDECEVDCNENGAADVCDIFAGSSPDVDGNGVPDECDPATIFVDVDATGLSSGLTWTDAFTDLQDALVLGASRPGLTSIWLAEGTYRPDGPGGDRNNTFALTDGVSIFGGFDGTETSLAQRDSSMNLTILSGDLNSDDTSGGSNVENAFHVVTADYVWSVSVLDGLTIERGNTAPGFGGATAGGGMTSLRSSLSVRNCTFRDNNSGAGGGAVYLALSSATLVDVNFEYNSGCFGGGLAISGDSYPDIDRCLFLGNNATGGCVGGSAEDGGAMLVEASSTPRIRNCVYSGNVAELGGGYREAGNFAISSRSTIQNCSFSDNIASVEGGGISIGGSKPVIIENSVSWGNTSNGGSVASAQVHDPGGIAQVSYSCVEDADPDDMTVYPGIGNIDDDPLFVDPDGDDDIVGTEDDDLRLSAGSPAIDAGDNDSVTPGTTLDLDGFCRFVDDPNVVDSGNGTAPIVDMGAYEYLAAITVEGVGGRYLSISPQAPGSDTAMGFLVTCSGGLSKYVGAPDGETSVIPFDLTNDRIPDGSFGVLVDDPADALFLTPTQWMGTVYITARGIIPETQYDVQADCGEVGSPALTAPVSATTYLWGDVDNNGAANLDDVNLIVLAFQGNFLGVTRANCDLDACMPNQIINMADAFVAVLAFQGQSFQDVMSGCGGVCAFAP